MKRRQIQNDVARPLENRPFQTMPITVRIPQAVAMLGMSRSKLYQFIQSGEIEIVKIGRLSNASLALSQQGVRPNARANDNDRTASLIEEFDYRHTRLFTRVHGRRMDEMGL